MASLLLARDLSSLYYPLLDVGEGHHGASHDDLSEGYERISRFHLSQLAYLAQKIDAIAWGVTLDSFGDATTRLEAL